jgi:ribosomal protein S18 acetylase RimI-like enzyme
MDACASPVLAAIAAYLRYLERAAVTETIQRAGVYAVRSGVFSNSNNGVVVDGDAPVTAGLVGELDDRFAERGLPASWLCGEGVRRPATATVLEACGWTPERTARGMRARLASLLLSRRRGDAEAEVEPVESTRALNCWLGIAGACGWFETDAQRAAWESLARGLPLGGSAELKLYLAKLGTRQVGMASAFYAGDYVFLMALRVLEEARRRGIGRSLALTRLREARARGCVHAVLEPRPDGAALH